MKPSFSRAACTPSAKPAAASTSPPPAPRSPAAWIASRPPAERAAFVEGLSANATAALPWLFEFWARPDHQLPPEGDWTTWLILGGRGAGKTRAGAEWVRAQVEGAKAGDPGVASRVALVGQTWEQARDVMVFGESGILACTPPDRRPDYVASRRMLRWPNGAEATLFSAADPESLRGPQFDAAWSDELAKWRRAEAAWDMLQFGLRLGPKPRQVVTTTPKDHPLLRALIAAPETATTSAPTSANAANLARDFLTKVTRRYAGTAQGLQELDGEMPLESDGALFSRARIDAGRVTDCPAPDRLVIGVDPPVTSGPDADACGIVAVARAGEHFYVLADHSVRGATPAEWAARVVEAAREHRANRIVAEVNQGGELVAAVIRRVDPHAALETVRAAVGKAARAEPVSLLYEQGRVRHVGRFPALEDELCAFGRGGRSPDRVDALVWAITALIAGPAGGPRVRNL